MTPLKITLEIPHMTYMFHQLTMSGKIMQENMGNDILIVITTGLQSRN